MPTYEKWKYCEKILENGKVCGEFADSECVDSSCQHTDHPRFICRDHLEEYDT